MKKTFKLIIYFFILLPLISQAQWKWLNPKPQGYNLNSVKFINTNTGFAVGDKGIILKTIDGGTNWIVQKTSITFNLYSVSFTDINTGFAVGDMGTILSTTDGGKTWTEKVLETPFKSSYFINKNVGYLAGQSYSKNGIILKTTDGGNTWINKDSGISCIIINSIAFSDTSIGYAVGDSGKIFKTINSGISWTAQSSGDTTTLTSVCFIDSLTGFAVSSNGKIIKTIDGGKNWITSSSKNAPLNSIYFFDANTGFATGMQGTILSTTDGGKNWSKQTTNTISTLNSIIFIDSKTGFAVGKFGKTLKTTDGGKTWTSTASASENDLLSVDFINTNNGLIVGLNGTILKTTDGGKTLTTLTANTSNSLNSVRMLNSNVAYIAGSNGTILQTTNGGSKWSLLNSGTTKNLRSLYFTDVNIGYAVGDSGIILKTTNGGSQWDQQSSGTTSTLYSIFFPVNDTGYAVSDSGKIVTTTDGGKTWILSQPTSIGPYYNLRSVYFTDSKTGYVAGPGSNLYSTKDGGVSWMFESAYSSGMGMVSFISSVCMTKDGKGYAVGDGGNILQGPGMWNGQFQNSPASNPLYSVCFPANDTGYAVGDGGTILKTVNGGCGKPVVISPPDKNIVVCKGNTLVLDIKATGTEPLEYVWQYSDYTGITNNIVIGNQLILNTDSIKYGYYSYFVENQCGMIREDSISISVRNVGSYFNLAKLDTLKNTATFNSNLGKSKGTRNGYYYFWDFDNGQYSNLQNPTIQFNAGNYNVCLTTTDSITGCQAKNCFDYNFGGVPKCKASFTHVDTTLSNSHFPLSFHADSTDFANTTYHWEFGNGVTWDCIGSSVTVLGYKLYCKNPIMDYQKEGYYKVKLTVMCPASPEPVSDSYEEIIQIGNPQQDCKADYIYNLDLNTHTAAFINQSKGLLLGKYLWDFGNGDTTSIENPIYTFKDNDFHNVCLSVSSDWCKNIKCQKIKTGDDIMICSANFNFTIDSASKTASFIDKSMGNPTSWIWNFGDGQGTSTKKNPKYTYQNSGIYQVSLEINNNLTSCTSFQNEVINVATGFHMLRCKFGYIENKKFNTKGVFPVEFKGATYGDADEVEWDFGDSTSNSSSLSPSHQYADTGTYNVCMIVNNANLGQSDTSCSQVKVLSDNIIGIYKYNNLNMSLSNYPNPMNNSTNIIYTLPSSTNVELNVYNITGNKISTLINSEQSTGKYKVEWNGSGLSNGLYYLQLKTNAGVVTNKIIILK